MKLDISDKRLKTAGIIILMILVTILTVKFLQWNFWKVDRAFRIGKKIISAPAAVNLKFVNPGQKGAVVYQKGFPFNLEGNYYIVDQFDLTAYIDRQQHVILRMQINRVPYKIESLHRFEYYTIVGVSYLEKKTYFIFTRANCPIEEFVKLKDSVEVIIKNLPRDN